MRTFKLLDKDHDDLLSHQSLAAPAHPMLWQDDLTRMPHALGNAPVVPWASAAPKLEQVQHTGADANRIDIVFLGDGYRSSEIASTYTNDVQELVGYLLSGGGQLTDPFGRYAKFFNIYRADVISQQSGADDPASHTTVNTALNASYLYDGVTDRLLYIDESLANAALDAAIAGTGIHADMRFVTVNDSKYGGGGGNYGVYAGGNANSLEIAVHEIGHAFAHLGDEYTYGGPSTYTGGEFSQPDLTVDPTGHKWKKWIGYNQPGIGVIGAYEGGSYSEHGVYRPSQDSKMRDLGEPFDAIGREAFIRMFYSIVDPLDSFTKNTKALTDPKSLTGKAIDASIIFSRWSVDGATVSDAHVQSFAFEKFNVASGHHTIDLLAYDPTDWVRGDRSDLQEHITWDVTLAHAVLRASDTVHSLTGGNLIDTMVGTDAKDTLNGGAGNDILTGAGGADLLIGGKDTDSFIYSAASNSTGTAFDTVRGFDASADKFDLWVTVAKIDKALTTGALSKASFDTDLTHDIGKALKAHHAILFTADSGSYDGKTFLVVDANGKAGYQTGADLVTLLDKGVHLDHLSTADFV